MIFIITFYLLNYNDYYINISIYYYIENNKLKYIKLKLKLNYKNATYNGS